METLPPFVERRVSERRAFHRRFYGRRSTDSDPVPISREERKSRFWGRVWLHSVLGFGILIASFTLVSLVSLKNQLEASWRSSLKDVQWLVLLKGSQLEVDEVGRFLKQLDGVGAVSLISSSMIVDQLKNDPLLSQDFNSEDVRAAGPESLPPIWKVSVTEETIGNSRLDDLLQEIRGYSAVRDVAFDQKGMNQMHMLRLRWAQVCVFLAALVIAGVVFVSLLLGRLFYFKAWRQFHSEDFWLTAAHDGIWGALGVAGAIFIFGNVSWPWVLVGVPIGFLRYIWILLRSEIFE